MLKTILAIIFSINAASASVTLPLSELSIKERFIKNDLNLDEKNFWRTREIFERIGEFGIELNDKGRCRYLTRKNLLQYGTQADWDCFFTFRNIVRETRFCAPDEWDGEFNEIIKVRGLFRYVGVAPLPFKYDLVQQDGKIIAKTSIYYKGTENFSETELQTLKEKVQAGVDLWNKKTPADLPYEIEVKIVDKKEDAHFKINLVRNWTRGPYLREHSIDWSYKVFAHEFGHMLGLDDEYDQIIGTLFGNSRCTNNSMMCAHRKDGFPRYYWYLIFRRAQCW